MSVDLARVVRSIALLAGVLLVFTDRVKASDVALGSPLGETAIPQKTPDATPAPARRGPLVPIPDARNAGPVDIEVTAFHSVAPGVSTREAVEKAWGKPKDSRGQGKTLVQLYSVEPFPQVEVSYADNKVASIIIRFEHGFPAGQVAEQLDLMKVQPVLVSNDLGEILGQAYPERGVLFSFEAATDPSKALKKVTHIILEPIGPEPFVLRAETNLDVRPEFALHDLGEALKLQPSNARAHWLRAKALATLGQYEKSVAAVAEAVRLDPKDPRYRVTKAQALAQSGHVDEAIPEAEQAVELAHSQNRPHVEAKAICLQGDLKASMIKPDFRLALQYHTRAIQAASALAADRHPAIRVAAKEVLVDAHLGAAHDIAWGEWRGKERAVENWLNKANALVDDLVKNENAGQMQRFRLCLRALSAETGVQGHLDPAVWVRDVVQSGESLIAESSEPGRRSQVQWEMAVALYDALQIYQLRADQPSALKYGELAIDYLEKSGRQNQSATTSYLLGRLYFRIGAVYAVYRGDHVKAAAWFDKAVPFLGRTPPPEALSDLGRLGDSFVSMGVSYWSTGRRDKAIAVTQHGANLMEEAVKRGIYDRSALTVPYTNLAAMQRELGNRQQATELEEMAAKSKASTLR